jgi:hypothetical protein
MAKRYGTPGPRILSPDAATSMKLAECSMQAQLLWTRLLTACDDQGRREAAVALVKAACFPLLDVTAKNVAKWLRELHDAELIHLYDAAGTEALQMTNWWEYQHTMRRAYPSKIDPPEGWTDLTGEVSAKDLANTTRVVCRVSRQNAADCRKVPASAVANAGAVAVANADANADGVEPAAAPHTEIDQVLSAFVELFQHHHPDKADKIPGRLGAWRKDVEKLLRLGQLSPADGKPIPAERALEVLSWMRHDEPPWSDGASWGFVVQSCAGLREKWERIADSKAAWERGRQNGARKPTPTEDAFAAARRKLSAQ